MWLVSLTASQPVRACLCSQILCAVLREPFLNGVIMGQSAYSACPVPG
jgi:hypothetical protein